MKCTAQSFIKGIVCVKIDNQQQLQTLQQIVTDAGKKYSVRAMHYHKELPYVYYNNVESDLILSREKPPFIWKDRNISFSDLEINSTDSIESKKEEVTLHKSDSLKNQTFKCVIKMHDLYKDWDLIRLYTNASDKEQCIINEVLTCLTGYSMNDLLKFSVKDSLSEEDAPELID